VFACLLALSGLQDPPLDWLSLAGGAPAGAVGAGGPLFDSRRRQHLRLTADIALTANFISDGAANSASDAKLVNATEVAVCCRNGAGAPVFRCPVAAGAAAASAEQRKQTAPSGHGECCAIWTECQAGDPLAEGARLAVPKQEAVSKRTMCSASHLSHRWVQDVPVEHAASIATLCICT
jgi:hypothetical protein